MRSMIAPHPEFRGVGCQSLKAAALDGRFLISVATTKRQRKAETKLAQPSFNLLALLRERRVSVYEGAPGFRPDPRDRFGPRANARGPSSCYPSYIRAGPSCSVRDNHSYVRRALDASLGRAVQCYFPYTPFFVLKFCTPNHVTEGVCQVAIHAPTGAQRHLLVFYFPAALLHPRDQRLVHRALFLDFPLPVPVIAVANLQDFDFHALWGVLFAVEEISQLFLAQPVVDYYVWLQFQQRARLPVELGLPPACARADAWARAAQEPLVYHRVRGPVSPRARVVFHRVPPIRCLLEGSGERFNHVVVPLYVQPLHHCARATAQPVPHRVVRRVA
mmetsp:Transcript_26876/g.65850  ORF Transcript_26876/g.65850 Transcript_26876/m.65850 type:complete len:332 (-) Transcript_26876:697-1692(-)